MEADVSSEVRQNDCRTPSVWLSPHELVHATGDHVCVDPLHSLELRLQIRLHVLCVDAGDRINEVEGVVDGVMQRHSRQLLDLLISSPLVTVDDGPWSEMSLDDG